MKSNTKILDLTVNGEIRAVIPTIESELQNYPLPELSGNDYRLYKYVCLLLTATKNHFLRKFSSEAWQ